MNWASLLWAFIRDTVFRQAVASILWPRIIRPFLMVSVKKIFEEAYAAVKRAVDYAEDLAERGVISPGERHEYAFRQIDDELKAYDLNELSDWAKNMLIEIAVGELDDKWDEFYGGD